MQLDDQMASYKTELKELDLSYNNLQPSDVTIIFARLKFTGLTEITFSSVPKYAANNAASDFISHNITLKEFYLSHEIPRGLIKSMTSSIRCLTTLHISHCEIHDQRASDMAEFLCHNKKLQELNLSHNNLQAADIIIIVEALNHLITDLTEFNVSNNNISDQAATSIAMFLSQNIRLKEIDISFNNLRVSGLMYIVNEMAYVRKDLVVSNMTKFNVDHNDTTDQEMNDIVLLISEYMGLEES